MTDNLRVDRWVVASGLCQTVMPSSHEERMDKGRKETFRWRTHGGVRHTYDEVAEKKTKKARAKLRRQRPEPGLRIYLGDDAPDAKQSLFRSRFAERHASARVAETAEWAFRSRCP